MAESLKSVQQKLLDEGYLDSLAKRYKENDTMHLSSLEEVLIASGVDFVSRVIDNLNELGKTDTGELIDGIAAGDLLGNPDTGYQLDIGYDNGSDGAKYYDYVNKGVSGTKNRIDSPYGYTDKMPPVSVIAEWVKRQNINNRNEDQKYNTSELQKKRKSVSDVSNNERKVTSLAFLIARSIKAKGLKKTSFFDDAVIEIYTRDILQPLGEAVASDVRVYIRQLDFLINKNKNK